MTSTEAVALASTVIESDREKAAPLLILVNAFLKARGDPMGEVMARDVKRFLWSLTEHSDAEMEKFISEAESNLSHLAA